jgi:hypothetical protein
MWRSDVVEVLGGSRESHDVHRFIHHSSSIKLTRALPPIRQNLLNIIAFISNPRINVASFFEPGPASEMAEKTVLQFLLAQFDGHSRGYVIIAAAAAMMVVTVTVTGPGRGHSEKTTRK